MNTQQQLEKKEKVAMEYTPFGGDTKIKLTVKIVQDMLCIKTKSGKVCNETDAIKFMMLCQARALNPFEGDAFLQGYDSSDGPVFSLITAHQAFLKRAEVNSDFDGMESGVIVRDGDGNLKEREGDFYEEGETLVGGWAKVYFKNRKIPTVRKLRLNTFAKSYGNWKTNPEGMIVKCAEADALRSSFPTKLGGLYIKDELPTDEEGRFNAAKPVAAKPSLLADTFLPDVTPATTTQAQPEPTEAQ